MKVIIRKKEQIKNIEQWFRIAPPKGRAKQWKKGRSALEMARFTLSKDFPKIIDTIIEEYGLGEKSFLCEPEATTGFEKWMGQKGPREHDLLMIGSDTIIGIEAKVSEPFDKKIKDKRKEAKEKKNENVILRLDSCLEYLYGEKVPENAEDLYYQLFSATIGSVIEAKKRNKKNVISLFIVFSGNIDADGEYEKKIQENDKAFKDFCSTLNIGETGGKIPFIPNAPDINCWVKKLVIDIGPKFDYRVIHQMCPIDLSIASQEEDSQKIPVQ